MTLPLQLMPRCRSNSRSNLGFLEEFLKRDFDLLSPLHVSYKWEDELQELIWQKGLEAHPLGRQPLPPEARLVSELFMEEDEMVSWLLPDPEDCNGMTAAKPAAEQWAPVGLALWRESAAMVGSSEMPAAAAAASRKRKARTARSPNSASDAGFESGNKRKGAYSSVQARRSRAVLIHNLSEQYLLLNFILMNWQLTWRRRDRISEKLKALQELIPWCNKLDRASVLEETIEYLTSLQLQIKIMSMRCNMAPAMFPALQTCMRPLGMGMRMDMSMAMSMGAENYAMNEGETCKTTTTDNTE